MMGIGISTGGTNYIGELDDNFTLVFTRLGAGAHVNFLFFSRVHIRLAAFHGRVTADDARGTFPETNPQPEFLQRHRRGRHPRPVQTRIAQQRLSKRNRIAPTSSPVSVTSVRSEDHAQRRHVPVAESRYRRTATYLSSGNYPDPYKLQQFCISMGIGFVGEDHVNFGFGVETGFRRLFTGLPRRRQRSLSRQSANVTGTGTSRYLFFLPGPSDPDLRANGKIASFSKRSNPKAMDWYVYTNAHLTYYFTWPLRPYKLKIGSRTGL